MLHFVEKYASISVEKALQELDSTPSGLDNKEVRNRLKEFGHNELPEEKTDSLFKIFFRQFRTPLIYILLVASVIVFFTGEKIDSFIIWFVILFNSVVGTIQEGKAQHTLLALKKMTRGKATVLRQGEEIVVPDRQLVPGDIIILREGEKIPADGRLVFVDSLRVDEASLTGESNPVYKTIDISKSQSEIETDRKNIIFKGTTVVGGTARAVIISTGGKTVIGGISRKIIDMEDELPLKSSLKNISRLILVLLGIIGFLLSVIGISRGFQVTEIFATFVALSVSVIPEGLPVVITLVLARGVWRMTKHKVLVKKMQAVEALGQIDILAMDKTGTITKNELLVTELYVNKKVFNVEGEGYVPHGKVFWEGAPASLAEHSELALASKIAALCPNVNVSKSKGNEWKVFGDPTEAAIDVFSRKLNVYKEELEQGTPRLDEMPFDYNLKYRAALHEEKQGDNFISVIGAPEVLIELAKFSWTDGKKQELNLAAQKELERVLEGMLKRGLRVTAFACKDIKAKNIKEGDISNLTLIGFFGIKDGLKENVTQAVKKIRLAGIKPVLISGDHRIIAESIAKEAGIFHVGDKVLMGEEIENMNESELAKALENVSVFARVTPMHKLAIIDAYKKRGEIVAMTGDGVNDALSLTAAEVGVSMGKIGTEVAKEASDIILLDDNFGNIAQGMEEGRNIYKTIKKVVLYLFSTSLGEILTIMTALFLSFPLPILPAQILWLNLVTDGFLDVALSFEPKEKKLLKKKLNLQSKWLVDKEMAFRMLLMSIPMALGTVYLFSQYFEEDMAKAWTVSLTVLAVFQWFNAWNCRSEDRSVFQLSFFSNKILLIATFLVVIFQIGAIYWTPMQGILKTVPLGVEDWIKIILIGISILVVEEIRKLIHRIRRKAISN